MFVFQQVDDSASLSSLVESLTSRNMDLSTQLTRMKADIFDLESAAEINEELDASQRLEIENLR
jgi:hypothetical protein